MVTVPVFLAVSFFWMVYVRDRADGQEEQHLGNMELALEALKDVETFTSGNSKMISLRGYILALAGRRNEAAEVLSTLEAIAHERYVPPPNDRRQAARNVRGGSDAFRAAPSSPHTANPSTRFADDRSRRNARSIVSPTADRFSRSPLDDRAAAKMAASRPSWRTRSRDSWRRSHRTRAGRRDPPTGRRARLVMMDVWPLPFRDGSA
jgi:hypothetical protein